MQILLPLLFFLAIIGFNIYRAKHQHSPLDSLSQWPYQKRDNPLTPEETAFYHALWQYLDAGLTVFPKMRIQNLVYASPESRITYALLDKMKEKYLDFAICASESLQIVCVIEFDDGVAPLKTANETADMERILSGAALTLYRFEPQYAYSAADFAPINEQYRQSAY